MNIYFPFFLFVCFHSIHCCRFTIHDGPSIGDLAAWISTVNNRPAVAFTDWSVPTPPEIKFSTAIDNSALNWQVATIVPAPPHISYGAHVEGNSLVNGSPILFFTEQSPDYTYDQFAITSIDSLGSAWNAPITVGIVQDGLSDTLDWLSIILSDGRPAFLHEDSDGFLIFRAATTVLATEFSNQRLLTQNVEHADIGLLADDRPVVVYTNTVERKLYLQTATTPAASAWNDAVWIGGYTFGNERFRETALVTMSDARVLLLHRGNEGPTYSLRYSVSGGPHGTGTWSHRTVVEVFAWQITARLLADGRPIVAFKSSGALAVVTAVSPTLVDATPWNALMFIDTSVPDTGSRPTLLLLQSGLPMIIYVDDTSEYIKAMIADDVSGASWDAPCQEPPTMMPSASPTKLPTENPTKMPTNQPTMQPTFALTAQPTVPPGAPSQAPTRRPTQAPVEMGSVTSSMADGSTMPPTAPVSDVTDDSSRSTPSSTMDAMQTPSRDDTLLIAAFSIAGVLFLCLIVAVICVIMLKRRGGGAPVDVGVRMSRQSRRSTVASGGMRHHYALAPRQSHRRSERRSKRASMGLQTIRLDDGKAAGNYSIPSMVRSSMSSSASTAYVELARKADPRAQVGVYQHIDGLSPVNSPPTDYASVDVAHYAPLAQRNNVDDRYTHVPNRRLYEESDFGK